MVEDVESFPAEFLNVFTASKGAETLIVIDGELDASGIEWFGTCVNEVLEKHPGSMTIRAGGVTFMDSSGLRSLLLARAAADEAGVAFRIDDPSPGLRRFIERTGLQSLLLNG